MPRKGAQARVALKEGSSEPAKLGQKSQKKAQKEVENEVQNQPNKEVKRFTLRRKLTAEETLPELYSGQEKKVFGTYERLDKIQESIRLGSICRGKITLVDRDKAYIDYEGVRGIIPKEELDERSLKGLIGFVGRPISFVIKGYDKEANIFAASRTEALELMKLTTLEQLKEGDIHAGTVVRVESWGCIMDLGGVLGRLSVADMLHTYVGNPNDVVQKGDYFDVLIKKIGTTAEGESRITLSLKDLIPVPWSRVTERYIVGGVASGNISGFLDGDKVFIKLEESIEGLADLEGYKVKLGQEVKALIRNIDTNRQRIKLKIVGVN